MVVDPLQWVFVSLFMMCTPVAMVCVFILGWDAETAAICNSYALSAAFLGLYLSPLLSPLVTGSFKERLNLATWNWVVWLTCLTQVGIQIAHSLLVHAWYANKGQPLEWPFYAYGLSDSRWSNYTQDNGNTFSLAPEVDLINFNDGGLGLIVLVTFLRANKSVGHKIVFILCTLFRDATIWRETVEYLLVHHHSNYSYSTSNEHLRAHSIICLYGINGLWLVAPVLTVVWSYLQITEILDGIPKKEN